MKAIISIRSFVLGFVAGVSVLAAVAWFYGPRVTSHGSDLLTGRTRRTLTWLGATIHERVEENDVSRWADQNSIPGIYAGQYGWAGSSEGRGSWFGWKVVACGGGMGPSEIFRGYIKLDGRSREEVLKKYQAELVERWKESGSAASVLRKWNRLATVKDSNSVPLPP